MSSKLFLNHPAAPKTARLVLALGGLILTVVGALLAQSPTGDNREWGPAISVNAIGYNVNTAALEGCPYEAPDRHILFFASNRRAERQ